MFCQKTFHWISARSDPEKRLSVTQPRALLSDPTVVKIRPIFPPVQLGKLSGIGMQLTSTTGDPDRACRVACQDTAISYRSLLTTPQPRSRGQVSYSKSFPVTALVNFPPLFPRRQVAVSVPFETRRQMALAARKVLELLSRNRKKQKTCGLKSTNCSCCYLFIIFDIPDYICFQNSLSEQE